MKTFANRISICIPHWQVGDFMAVCLRSIRQYSQRYDIEMIVVDNGSKDASLDWLRSLSWIRLFERPQEGPDNWPANVFTGWDLGIRQATGEFFLTMHSDVFVLREGWLDPLLREVRGDDAVAGAGVWKLRRQNPIYALQKRLFYYPVKKVKHLFGLRRDSEWKSGHYPRDFCALYRKSVILDNDLSFLPDSSRGFPYDRGGGYSIAQKIWDCGGVTRMAAVEEMLPRIVHVAHGTAGARSDKKLRHRRNQERVEGRVEDLRRQEWFQAFLNDASLDAPDLS